MTDDSRIRVLQFLTSTVRSGAEEVALEMVRGFDDRRIRSYLACPQALLDAFGADWRVSDVEAFPLTLESPWHVRAAVRFVAYLRSRRIQVVHAHMIRAAVAAAPLARLAGVPVFVHTCHGREAWRKGRLSRSYSVDRLIDRWTDATIAVSESTRNYLVNEKRLDSRRVVVIRNGRSLDGYERNAARERAVRSELGIGAQNLTLIVLGRLEEQKGHRYLIEALPQVFAAVPSLKVVFAGEGGLRQELESQVVSRRMEGRILFAGYRRDWKDLLAISDLVALPSLYEGMPLVPIEAAAMGKAVVATAVDGTCEVVQDGATGRLVPPANPVALAVALIELLLDSAERKRLGDHAYMRWRELFSIEQQLSETTNLYEQLLNRKASSVKSALPSSGLVATGHIPRTGALNDGKTEV